LTIPRREIVLSGLTHPNLHFQLHGLCVKAGVNQEKVCLQFTLGGIKLLDNSKDEDSSCVMPQAEQDFKNENEN
jgi:hypothetical protein